jgi:hypothetical protein
MALPPYLADAIVHHYEDIGDLDAARLQRLSNVNAQNARDAYFHSADDFVDSQNAAAWGAPKENASDENSQNKQFTLVSTRKAERQVYTYNYKNNPIECKLTCKLNAVNKTIKIAIVYLSPLPSNPLYLSSLSVEENQKISISLNGIRKIIHVNPINVSIVQAGIETTLDKLQFEVIQSLFENVIDLNILNNEQIIMRVRML